MSAVVGRRKTSVARVFLNPAKGSTGNLVINGRKFEEYFPVDVLQIKALEAFRILGVARGDYEISATVAGGGISGQAEAVRLGIARALIGLNGEHRSPLKKAGLLTRDPRMRERKKYGQPGARQKFQYSKR